MKLYAIRSKETGLWLGAEHGSLVFNENRGGFFGEDEVQEWRGLSFVESDHYEIITFRIEPTEPCKLCEKFKNEGWTFCGNCGRRLYDAEV